MAAHVLVVDDDPSESRHVEEILLSQGHSVESATSGEEALARLSRTESTPISAVILDLVMPELDGMTVLERMSRLGESVPVIVQTAPGGGDAGASAMRAGAFDFLVKPAGPERLRASLANALKLGALEGEILRIRRSRAGTLGLRDIVMHSSPMERVRQLAERAIRSSLPVLIEGERGVGKEILARAIHGSSARRNRPFVTVSSADEATFDPTMLFRDGAGRNGRLEDAVGGTLFIEEIGTLPSHAQKRLAELLADQSAASLQRRDIRLIASTSRRLIDLVSEEGFREDLFYRLNVLPIWVPPLRERNADISDLARKFLARLAAEAGRSGVTGISVAAMERLVAHDWPGNIRELEHAIFRAIMLSDGGELLPDDFPTISGALPAPKGSGAEPRGRTGTVSAAAANPKGCVALPRQTNPDLRPFTGSFADRRMPPRYGVARLLDQNGELRPFEVLEEEVIRFAIGHYEGRMSEVARRLGIGRSTLYRKIKDYGIVSEGAAASQ